jgi:predicted nucleotidyltransferase
MQEIERSILDTFKSLLLKRVRLHQVILFGSRARGDADEDSDMDVLVIVEDDWDWAIREYVSRCAWEAGIEHGILVASVLFSRDQWENSPERSSLFVQNVLADGIPV